MTWQCQKALNYTCWFKLNFVGQYCNLIAMVRKGRHKIPLRKLWPVPGDKETNNVTDALGKQGEGIGSQNMTNDSVEDKNDDVEDAENEDVEDPWIDPNNEP